MKPWLMVCQNLSFREPKKYVRPKLHKSNKLLLTSSIIIYHPTFMRIYFCIYFGLNIYAIWNSINKYTYEMPLLVLGWKFCQSKFYFSSKLKCLTSRPQFYLRASSLRPRSPQEEEDMRVEVDAGVLHHWVSLKPPGNEHLLTFRTEKHFPPHE